MIDVLDTIKQAYDRSTTQVDKIILNGKEYRISNIEYYDDTYLDGNIFGTAIGKNIDFEIENTVDLEGQEIEYLTGIIVDGTTQWISLGNFIIQDVQPNNTTNIAKVTATDYMLKTNIPYVSDLDYEGGKVTLLNLLQEVCTKSGLTLATTSFTNSTFIVDSNQFTEETLNRQVIQAVAQVSGTVAKIRNNQLYLINPNQIKTVSKVFTLNSYKEAEIKRATHPINLVSLGMADIEGENITLRDETSITKSGENSLVINDNPFAYTQAKREQLITALFNAVKGFEYKSYSFKNCQGLPYLETLDKIQFKDKEGNTYDSFIFRFNNKSPNGLESTIEAPSITKATVAYQNVPSALDIAKKTEIKVDKQNQTIQAVIEETNELQSQVTDITTTQATAEGTEIKIDDGAEEPIIKLEVDGASIQNGTPTPETPMEIQSVGDDVNLFDGEIKSGLYLGSSGVYTANSNYVCSSKETEVISGETITVSNKNKKEGTYYIIELDENKNFITSQKNNGYVTSYTFVLGNTTKYININLGYSAEPCTVENVGNFKLQKGTVATAYSEYGKGTVEIKQCGKNLIDTTIPADTKGVTITRNSDGTLTLNGTSTSSGSIIIAPMYKTLVNTNYTVSFRKISGNVSNGSPVLCKWSSAINDWHIHVKLDKFVTRKDESAITSNLVIYVDNGTVFDNLTVSIQIEEGTVATEYEPYKDNNYIIQLSQPLRSLPNGVKDTIEEDGTHRRVGRYVFTGNETIVRYAGGLYSFVVYTNTIHKYSENTNSILSNTLQNKTLNELYRARDTINQNLIAQSNVGFGVMINNFTTEEEIKSYLAEQYTNGTPVIVDYELEEVIEPFDEEQQAVIDSIKTNLYTQYFTCDANMRITYVRNNGLSDMYETKNNAIRKYAQQEMKLTETGALIESLVSVTNALNDGFKVGDEELQKKLEELGKNLEEYQLTTSTSFEQTEKNFQMKFNELIESINTNAEGNSEKFAEIVKYIRFENGNIVLGRSDNQLILKIQNDRISYQQNGSEVAYFSDNKLYVTTLEVTHSFIIGNFAFIPRANGNLSFKKVGGN